MILSFAVILASLLAPTLAEITLCMPGQCLEGFSNTTVGAVLSASGVASIQLLPGQYTNDTSPQLLHDLLTTSNASLSASPGFNGSLPLPLNLALSLRQLFHVHSSLFFTHTTRTLQITLPLQKYHYITPIIFSIPHHNMALNPRPISTPIPA
jgi:hypothetical protein